MSRILPPDQQRLRRGQTPTWERLQAGHAQQGQQPQDSLTEVTLDCGWGRLLIGHTFRDPQRLADSLLQETPGERDIALYVADPHVVLSFAPQQLFLDPSDTMRLWFTDYRPAHDPMRGFHIRRPQCEEDWQAINNLYLAAGMVQVNPQRLTPREAGGPEFWLAEDADSGQVIGTVMGLHHARAYDDPDKGSSLWCLAADGQTQRFGVGEMLVRHLVEYFMSRGSSYLDLSVLHDNRQAKTLYRKLGFRQLRTFTIKRKNSINQALFLGPEQDKGLNPYARIITRAARRKGIEVTINDAEAGLFTLTQGGRSIRCRESLSDLTSAVSMTLCQQKQLTHRLLQRQGLNTPHWRLAGTPEENAAFLAEHGALVVKPDNGEQGNGVAVNLRDADSLERAIAEARQYDSQVLLESYHPGQDLRVVVINYQVVAAAIRQPAQICGDGRKTVRQLIEKQSRRRQASTHGESRIPLDEETRRTVEEAGYDFESVLPANETLQVRRTANLHTGGVLVDVTSELHPNLAEAAIQAARALEIPVVGMDLLVPAADQPDYVIIEANERPGLANHEPQPTAECFIDLLFPLSQAV
ncbi:GNAT-family acetyltransferase TIGR03103 [Halopseudomonas formosensis]|uniref:GNAT-family acetyltransferase TIGR03103 n=1 Tax=Halopseudomonas formosensis TaxID=1002526 RepID=A0A1I6BQP3_9GAMM|nr:N-acetylglutaminylglutamine synthetase [Halopseudomonas formosensis]SFQ83268.1 GNAT-family acetyltransferase TIGR03103 [Halopseudomonas formosensis]